MFVDGPPASRALVVAACVVDQMGGVPRYSCSTGSLYLILGGRERQKTIEVPGTPTGVIPASVRSGSTQTSCLTWRNCVPSPRHFPERLSDLRGSRQRWHAYVQSGVLGHAVGRKQIGSLMNLDPARSIRTYTALVSVNSRIEEEFALDLRARGGCAELYPVPRHPWARSQRPRLLLAGSCLTSHARFVYRRMINSCSVSGSSPVAIRVEKSNYWAGYYRSC